MPTASKSDKPRVAIVGGGLAGLAAASVLAPHGVTVTLFEARGLLGGRASSFIDPESGELIDACQHVSMGCCTNLADFCRRLGLDDLFVRRRRLLFLDETGKINQLRATPLLPAPFHLTLGFAGIQFL